MGKEFKVKVRLQGDSTGAEKAVKKTEGAFKRFGRSVSENRAQLVAWGVALFAAVRAIGAVARASLASEDAIQRANAAMKLAGDFSEEASKGVQKWADNLQRAGTVSNEAALEQFALAKSFAGTTEAAQALVDTAVDFSQAAKINLEEAVRRLGRSLSGSVDDVSKFDSRINDLTKSELANGGAVKLLGEKYAGLDAELSKTAAGGLKKLSNELQDLTSAIGDALIRNDDFKSSLSGLTETIDKNTDAIGGSAAILVKVSSGILAGIIEKFENLGIAIGSVAAKMEDLTRDDVEISMVALESRAAKLGITVDQLNVRIQQNIARRRENTKANNEGVISERVIAAAVAKTAEEVKGLGGEAKTAADAVTELGNALGILTTVEVAKEIDEITKNLATAREELGANSREYIRLEEVASAKIDSLRVKLRELENGLAGVTEESAAAVPAVEGLGVAMDGAATSTERVNAAIRQTPQLLAASALAFDRLAASAGRAAATEAAVAAGARRSGNRVFFPGGSRFVTEPGLTGFSNLSGGTFTTIRKTVKAGADGRLEIL